jgi:restriction endonuclease S subunit
MVECFCVNSKEIKKRIDPHFYRLEFIELEKKVSKNTNKILEDFIVSISGGATPSRQQDSELYTNKENGIPFLRVQNITEEGLILDDVKYITREVHEGKLKRSQVKEGDLLITITGRIASSCVVPKGFEGNINQHSVVIQTKDKKTAEIISAFLNSSIGHKLAIRRTSGGSRLALDYIALKSIPIILNEKIVSLMDNAHKEKKNKEEETNEFLDSINDYILDELGIKLPEFKKKMCFILNFNEVKTGRIDPISFVNFQDTLGSNKFKEKTLGEISILTKGQSITKENITSGDYPVIAGGQSSPYTINVYNHKENIITVSASGAYSGYVWYHDKAIFASDCTVVNSLDEKEISTFYLYCVMKAKQKFIYNMQQGAGQPHVYSRDLSKLKIPLPPISVQNKIVEEVKLRMQKIKALQKEAKEKFKKAKLESEKIMLG